MNKPAQRFFQCVLVLALAISAGSAAYADTKIGVTTGLFFGRHIEQTTSTPINGLPAPLLFVDQRTGRVELYVEALTSLGQIDYKNPVPSAPAWTKLSYIRGTARYYSANGRYYAGVGAISIYQKTGYVPTTQTINGFVGTGIETDTSRLAGIRYEIGASLPVRSSRLALNFSVVPNLRATLTQDLLASAVPILYAGVPFEADSSATVPEHGSEVDTSIAIQRTSKHTFLSYGVRDINYSAKFDDGELADRNEFLIPFLDFAWRVGR